MAATGQGRDLNPVLRWEGPVQPCLGGGDATWQDSEEMLHGGDTQLPPGYFHPRESLLACCLFSLRLKR